MQNIVVHLQSFVKMKIVLSDYTSGIKTKGIINYVTSWKHMKANNGCLHVNASCFLHFASTHQCTAYVFPYETEGYFVVVYLPQMHLRGHLCLFSNIEA